MRSHRSRIGDAAADGGFTLIEVLVALMILSISLAVLLAIFTQGLERAQESENEANARQLAQSLLVQAQSASNPALGYSSGRSGTMFWSVRLVPFGGANDIANWKYNAAQIFATVSWRGYRRTRAVSLTSLRFLPKAPSQ